MIKKNILHIIHKKTFYTALLLALLTPFIYEFSFFGSASYHFLFSFFDLFIELFFLNFDFLFVFESVFLSATFWLIFLSKLLVFYIFIKLVKKYFNSIIFPIVLLSLFIGISIYIIGNKINTQKPDILKSFDTILIPKKIEKKYKINSSINDLKEYLNTNLIDYNLRYLINNKNDCEYPSNSNIENLFWCYEINSINNNDTGIIDIHDAGLYYVYFKNGKIVKYSKIYMGYQVDKVLLNN